MIQRQRIWMVLGLVLSAGCMARSAPRAISTAAAPAPLGAYSQAVMRGDTLYVSGQVAIDPKTKALITENIEAETHQVMSNLKAVLTAAGMTFADVVRSTVYLSDFSQFGAVNGVYAQYFQGHVLPARAAVPVGALPKGLSVEISMIARKR